jgi:hypothetical protein
VQSLGHDAITLKGKSSFRLSAQCFILTTKTIGPSGVRALPMAAGIKVGGHYKWHFVLLYLLPESLLILTEGVVIVTKIFIFQPPKKFGNPPYPPHYVILGKKGGYFESCPRVPKFKI